jgi:peptidoglycan/xylan/chitin deacetylase (PgdA/CDA1 family)
MFYLTTTPFWLRAMFPRQVEWKGPAVDNTIYLTFDDGPEPEATPFVLEQLERFGAKATFFCIGANVQRYPSIFRQVLDAGHAVGNHTMTHPNGWHTDNATYVAEIEQTRLLVDSRLFRPPYGRIRHSQVRAIHQHWPNMRIVMWSVVTGDFDSQKSGEWCARQAINKLRPGGIVVFHDSQKALPRLQVALPKLLDNIATKGWQTGLL